MGLRELIAEEIRTSRKASDGGAGLGNDDRYWRESMYAWAINDGHANHLFPMVLNPTRYHEKWNFAVSFSPTQAGKVYVEQNGIILGDLTIEGHTGVKPRVNKNDPSLSVPLSGQAHFLRLQRQCFEFYSDLKKNAHGHANVVMTFHNFRDNKHFVVEPVMLDFPRTVDKRLHYPYTIEMKIVGLAEHLDDPSEDKELVDGYRATVKKIAKQAAALQASIEDTSGFIGDVDAALAEASRASAQVGVGVTLARDFRAEVLDVLGKTAEVIRGVKRVAGVPYTVIQTLLDDAATIATLLNEAGNIPVDVVQSYRMAEDALAGFAAFPDFFVEDEGSKFDSMILAARGAGTQPTAALDAAATEGASTPRGLQNTDIAPGDRTRVEGGVFQTTLSFPRYTGLREIIVLVDDTLEIIARRELRDARRWVDLAIVNNLQAPYISIEGLPRTLRPGAKMNIPIEAVGPAGAAGVSSAGGGDPEIQAVQYDVVLGRDLALAFDGELADLVIDPSTTDVATVSGIPNMVQALTVIVSTTRGEDVLFRGFGLPELIGKRGTFDRLVSAQLGVRQAINRDSRVASTRDVNIALDGDQLIVEADVVLVDGTNEKVVSRVLQ